MMKGSPGKLCLVVLCVMHVLSALARADVQAPPGAPPTTLPPSPEALEEMATQGWVAFLAYEGGYTMPEYSVLNKTPNIILFKDGRLVWRDDSLPHNAPNRRREMWREAQISPDALKAFIAKAIELEFMTIQPPPPEKPKTDANGNIILSRPMIADAATSILGLRLEFNASGLADKPVVYHRDRIVSEYALGAFADKENRYIQSLLTMEKMLKELRPKESKRHEPESIRVTLLDSNSRGTTVPPDTPIREWPFPYKTFGGTTVYTGGDAIWLRDFLTKYPLITVDEKTYTAIWTPAIAVPKKVAPELQVGNKSAKQ